MTPSSRVPADLVVEIKEHLSALLAYATAFTGSRASAQDLVQEAIVRLIALPAIPPSPVVPYLKTTIRHLHIDAVRAAERSRRLGPRLDRRSCTADISEDVALSVDLRAALDRLSPLHRTVLVLRYLDDLTTDDIARELQRPAGTVRRLIHEALKGLRALGFDSMPPSAPPSLKQTLSKRTFHEY